jgi:tripartite-type tricarboxylate transporter receptor subunit TctC
LQIRCRSNNLDKSTSGDILPAPGEARPWAVVSDKKTQPQPLNRWKFYTRQEDRREEVKMKQRGFVTSVMSFAILPLSLFCTSTVNAQGEPFYKGKQIRIIVGLSSGGGYDRAARMLARTIGKHIPGNPDIVVQNMPGASSVTAANYVWGVAKPDGLTILAPHNNVYLAQLSGQKEVQFDLPKFQWIGSLENDDMMLFGRADAPFKSIGDIVRAKEPPKCGSTGVGSSDYVMSKILEETIGAKVTAVTGYPGSSEIAIALERGEVSCMGLTISTYFGREPFLSWLKTKFVRFLAQSGRKRQSRVEEAPTIYELMDEYKTPATKRRVAEAMLQGGEWARPYMVTPGTPADRVAILRVAFDKAVKDPELLSEAKKLRMDITPMRGEQLQVMAKEVMVQPPEVIEQIKKLFVH